MNKRWCAQIKRHLCQDVDIFALTPMHALPGTGLLILPFVCSPFFPSAAFYFAFSIYFLRFPLLFTWSVASSLPVSPFTSRCSILLLTLIRTHISFCKWLHLRIDAQMRTKLQSFELNVRFVHSTTDLYLSANFWWHAELAELYK